MRLIAIIFLALGLFGATMFAQEVKTSKSQKAIRFYQAGMSEYRMGEYLEAEELLLKAIKADTNFQEAYFVIAELYWDAKNYEQAIKMYNKALVINPEFYPQGYVNKGDLELRSGLYDEALDSYENYLALELDKPKKIKEVKRRIDYVSFSIEAKNNPVDFEPIRLSDAINTDDDEYWPALSADAHTLVFTRLVGSGGGMRIQEDFYISSYDSVKNDWAWAKDAGTPLNTYDNEGAQTISANGKIMVYTVCNRKGIIGRCDLYISVKSGDQWSEPVNMGMPVNTKYKETQPSLSSDGRTLYFVSDRPGGLGRHDIWVTSQGISGRWSEPVSLGDSVNTPGFESSPFIHHDNNTLYFSSSYHLGLGGFDLFYSRRNKDGQWGKVKNLGYPINTHRDEIGLIIDAKGKTAYYASDIQKKTRKDIYKFELYEEARPAEVSYLKGKVFDGRTRKALKAEFELYDLKNGTLIARSLSDIRNGEFLICLPTDRNYMLNVSKEGYLFYSENFSLEGVHQLEKPFYKDIPLKEIVVGKSIVLRNVFFETDDYKLKSESKTELDKVVKFMLENPERRVEISGHTDNIGSEAYNLELSKQRAQSVIDYLNSQGVIKERLESVGYGFSKPIATNESEIGRSQNRRTELKIIE